ncbi:hypothetical protein TNCV_2505441 [Trichonephila clavipes]|uniref:Uncharacterized protein n=1 Tax=Trichonephila clavipes TaxID=2585209 RepID=A0A8X6WHZ4_TRICX|nr:hypothetical protein TNCV_2505441 [Trichonephila clavipes]
MAPYLMGKFGFCLWAKHSKDPPRAAMHVKSVDLLPLVVVVQLRCLPRHLTMVLRNQCVNINSLKSTMKTSVKFELQRHWPLFRQNLKPINNKSEYLGSHVVNVLRIIRNFKSAFEGHNPPTAGGYKGRGSQLKVQYTKRPSCLTL